MTFSDLPLRPELAATVAELGYDEPTPIQAGLIPVLLDGRDAIGQARTGTGKTAAFALPMLHKLAARDDRGTVRALVLAPTRELAVQVSSAVFTYGRALNVRTLPITGGQPYHKQTRRLRQGVDVVVATPGRLVDLLNQGLIDLSHVETVVLDEADEMLSMGFADDLETILQATPTTRQTALLSATLPARIRQIAGTYLDDPETIAVADGDRTAAAIEQRAYLVRGRDKLAALVRLIETDDVTSALAFVRTREATSRLAADLSELGYAAEPISGELSQGARTAVLSRFKNQRVRILVATDVAARGLDIDHVSHVFNVDLPVDSEAYVHRVGRTGRAGRDGTALSLVDPRERGLLHRVERYAKREIPFADLPTVEDVEAVRRERLAASVADALDAATDTDRKLVLDLVAAGEDPMRIAAAAFAVAREARAEAPVLPIQPVHDRRPSRGPSRGPSHSGDRNAREHGYVRLALDAGRDEGVLPGQVVSALARTADIPGKAIGKILIHDEQTLVDVPENLVDRVLAQSGDYRFGKRLAEIEVV
ncbi:DEAD/DEAH box helicase [Rubrivirga sp.]|uniref:DEAD/DEAH box helicase n=1 Tax=Rubrivirga sp. TaxID=1885344 RepID=UPI003B51D443